MRLWVLVGLMAGLAQGQNYDQSYCTTTSCTSYFANRQCCQDCVAQGNSVSECNAMEAHIPLSGPPDNRIGGCQPCPMNQFSQYCSCQQCDPCGDWGYYATPCYGDHSGSNCRVCRGLCGAGEAELHGCGRPNYNRDRECGQCPAGKYRDNVNTQPGCVDCISACGAGWKQTRACGPMYDRQCEKCPDDSYVVGGDTCVACTTGKYRTADKLGCADCSTCTRFQSSSGCNGAVNRICTPCGGFKYTRSVNAATCAGCENGYFDAGNGACSRCDTSSCGNGNYRICSFTEAYGGKQECYPCQGQKENATCSAGFGVSTRCDGQGTTMVSCTACGPGKHRPAGTGLVGDIQTCVPCLTGFFKPDTGSAACSACSNKPASNAQYVTWGALLPSSNTCPW